MTVANAHAIKGIDIVTYLAQDAPRAVAFYRDVLGLPISREYGDQGAEFELPDGASFGVWKMDDGTFTPSSGVMFAVDDLREAVPAFRARGVTFEMDGAIDDTPVCLMAFAKDTEGNGFVLHQRK